MEKKIKYTSTKQEENQEKNMSRATVYPLKKNRIYLIEHHKRGS